jgi:hypothetical protein
MEDQEQLVRVVDELPEIKHLMSSRSPSNIAHETQEDEVSQFHRIILYVIIHCATLSICTDSYRWFMFFVGLIIQNT